MMIDSNSYLKIRKELQSLDTSNLSVSNEDLFCFSLFLKPPPPFTSGIQIQRQMEY